MTAKKRDQSHHDLVRQYLPDLILNTILGIICELGDPYDAKPGLGGMTAYPPMAMAAVCIMLEAEHTTHRKMAGIPRNNHAMATKMGLTKIPLQRYDTTFLRADPRVVPGTCAPDSHPRGGCRIAGRRQHRIFLPEVRQVV